jgi:Flp pilus assembly protein CpaB
MSAESIVLIIAALALGAVQIITALKVKNIEHSVNSAATASVAKIEALTVLVASLTQQLADEKQVAERLAKRKKEP